MTTTTVYTTSTPIITSRKYHFNYASKRDAYVDACYACLGLNQAAKAAPDNYKHYLYRLKNRWIEMLYRRGFCVRVYEDYGLFHFQFKIDGILFAWHVPEKVVSWSVKEKRGPVQYDCVKDLPLRTRPLEEAVALLEWCLGK